MAPPVIPVCRVCGQPRAPKSTMALCETHQREYNADANRRSVANGSPARTKAYHRLYEYRSAAVQQGASETEALRIAMAADVEFERCHGRPKPRWLVPFVAHELAYLRETEAVRAKLDAWQPASGDRDGQPDAAGRAAELAGV